MIATTTTTVNVSGSRAASPSFQYHIPGGIRTPNGTLRGLDTDDCLLLRGDLDYVANQPVIRNCFDLDWTSWKQLLNNTLRDALRDPAPLVSLYARARSMDEAELLSSLAQLGNQHPDVGVLFHFFNVEGMSRALDIYQGRPLINYISGESWALKRVLPMLARHSVSIVVQPVDDTGIPSSVATRMDVVSRIADAVEPLGIERQHIYVDALTPALGTMPFPLDVSIETIAAARQAGFKTILWPANAGLGHADGAAIAATYVVMAIQAGLNIAVVNSADRLLCGAVENANRICRHA